ncbi:DM9 repeat,Domain of unknown function DUF3421 [Cinara cedri]|uniref:Uncharacterized protein n=1 Tax=Cinara cedri TaxID=506608 RepID=A0A5E4NEX4_9HEMI|nr:DM9 repeat,Domain of unknown function DUF3421 [Cinara cedri]
MYPSGAYGMYPRTGEHHHHHHHHHLTWIPRNSGDPLPHGAVRAGVDKGGVQLYAGRAFHDGHLLPAKINPNHSSAYVCLGGLEHAIRHYEVLCHVEVAWISAQGSTVPQNAVVIGHSLFGEKLYLGRTLYDGILTLGKVHPSHRRLYFPYNGLEKETNEYEIMIHQPYLT